MSLLFDSVSSTTTAPDSISPDSATSRLDWELIFDGVWLARRDGRFAGMAQGAPGDSIKLTDDQGNVVGIYASLAEAKSVLSSVSE